MPNPIYHLITQLLQLLRFTIYCQLIINEEKIYKLTIFKRNKVKKIEGVWKKNWRFRVK